MDTSHYLWLEFSTCFVWHSETEMISISKLHVEGSERKDF